MHSSLIPEPEEQIEILRECVFEERRSKAIILWWVALPNAFLIGIAIGILWCHPRYTINAANIVLDTWTGKVYFQSSSDMHSGSN